MDMVVPGNNNNNNNNNIDFYLAHTHEIHINALYNTNKYKIKKIKHTCNVILKLMFIIYVIDKKHKTCIQIQIQIQMHLFGHIADPGYLC